MLDIFSETLEYQNWGWNALTVSAVATTCFTCIQWRWGLWEQFKVIQKPPFGESVSVGWHVYFVFLFITCALYGVYLKSAAMVFNGLLSTGHFLVLIALWRHKRFTRTEKLFSVSLVLMPIAILLLPWKTWVFLIVNFASIAALSLQPWEVWRNRSAGSVDLRLLLTYFLATFFWVAYSYAVGDWALKIITPIVLFLLGFTFWLCRFKYPASKKTSTQ